MKKLDTFSNNYIFLTFTEKHGTKQVLILLKCLIIAYHAFKNLTPNFFSKRQNSLCCHRMVTKNN